MKNSRSHCPGGGIILRLDDLNVHDFNLHGPHLHTIARTEHSDATAAPVRSLSGGANEVSTMLSSNWSDWQQQVVAVIRVDLHDVLGTVNAEDVDWEAWRPLFDEGRTPQAAVARAFLREPTREM